MNPESKKILRDLAVVSIFLFIGIIYFSFDNIEISPTILFKENMNFYFDADAWRVYENLINSTNATHYRDKVHPLFSLVNVPLMKLTSLLACKQSLCVAQSYLSTLGVIGTCLFGYFLYRECGLIVSISSVSLLLSTASWLVWVHVPESFLIGFVSLFAALLVFRNLSPRFSVPLGFLLSASATITNAFLGMACAIKDRTLEKRGLALGAGILVILVSVQTAIFPTSAPFLNIWQHSEEILYVETKLNLYPLRLFDFLFSGFLLAPVSGGPGEPISSISLVHDWLTST